MVVALLLTVLILGLAYLLWSGVHVLLQAFAGVLFAIFLSALSDGLSRRTGLPYRWALAAVVLGLLVLTGATAWLLANRLATQLGELAQRVPQSLEQIRNYLAQYPWGELLLEQVPHSPASLAGAGFFSRVTGLISGVADVLITAGIVLFVGIFGAAEPDLYKEGFSHLVPSPYRGRLKEAVDALAVNLRWWLLGQVLLMVMMWLTTTLGLWLLGVPLALTLGLIAGFLELVPYIGAWLAAVPAALMALLVGPGHLLMTLALFLGLHILEGYVYAPLVQRRAVLLPPALTIVMQALLGILLGLMGLFVAAPLTVSAVVLLKMLYVEDTLGDATVTVPGEPGKEPPPLLPGGGTGDEV
jgi:predicted PurR-regulated permease PerM